MKKKKKIQVIIIKFSSIKKEIQHKSGFLVEIKFIKKRTSITTAREEKRRVTKKNIKRTLNIQKIRRE